MMLCDRYEGNVLFQQQQQQPLVVPYDYPLHLDDTDLHTTQSVSPLDSSWSVIVVVVVVVVVVVCDQQQRLFLCLLVYYCV